MFKLRNKKILTKYKWIYICFALILVIGIYGGFTVLNKQETKTTTTTPIMQFAILPELNSQPTYYVSIHPEGILKCDMGTRISYYKYDYIGENIFSSIKKSSEKKLNEKDFQTLKDMANEFEKKEYFGDNPYVVSDGWRLIFIYNEKWYEMDYSVNNAPKEFIDLINKIIKLSPVKIPTGFND